MLIEQHKGQVQKTSSQKHQYTCILRKSGHHIKVSNHISSKAIAAIKNAVCKLEL